ncbi:DGQHR domain-containing protein DpdB [Wenzhouxiangella sp. XN24]|uniref:DGQHR domain-containing protein DpdB n=1 Tax=Wenzhouxiangella sp. XN24 TaxID=2713569 RepID=UPI0013EC8248|nr:DGQHR domain-containing protein DpdB [Wenzhouxiangella sp. XN24]NGX16019.1 DGQHR domain-containing protein [Wenzhouxiangella sp. XN24]
MKSFTYQCLIPHQATGRDIFTFCASVDEILQFATVERIGRTASGQLKGFQRPHVAKHIAEIRDYLTEPDAILPNAVVIAFPGNAALSALGNRTGKLTIDCNSNTYAYVVDGQQRLAALNSLKGKRFEVLVAGFMCEDLEELKRQFILINNARPLSKSLIYELLPTSGQMPSRLSVRTKAAQIVERLNFDESSSLFHEIRMHTNPAGVIRDTAIQRVAMSSLNDGALRHLAANDNSLDKPFQLLSNFYGAVKEAFKDDWREKTPRTSRLVHGVGVVSLGYVAEFLHSKNQAFEQSDFSTGLYPLVGRTRWSSGSWEFGIGDTRPWDSLQNVARDWIQLADHLIGILVSTTAKKASPK